MTLNLAVQEWTLPKESTHAVEVSSMTNYFCEESFREKKDKNIEGFFFFLNQINFPFDLTLQIWKENLEISWDICF